MGFYTTKNVFIKVQITKEGISNKYIKLTFEEVKDYAVGTRSIGNHGGTVTANMISFALRFSLRNRQRRVRY